MASEWYQKLRDQWEPEHVQLLLIGESPPDDRGDVSRRRFFYADRLERYDNLFRSVIAALYDEDKLSTGSSKAPWLERLRADGVYLIDLAVVPINRLTPPLRREARKASVIDCLGRIREPSPDGIVVCHMPTFKLLAGPLQAASLPLLHQVGIPFPLPNKRKEFVEKVRPAVAHLL